LRFTRAQDCGFRVRWESAKFPEERGRGLRMFGRRGPALILQSATNALYALRADRLERADVPLV